MTAEVDAANPPKLDLGTKLFYGVGSIAYGAKTRLLGLLLFFYNQLMGLDAAWVSAALSASIVIDAIWDPTIGQLSDRTRSRFGRRHPYMYAAAIPVCLALWLLWHPPHGWPKAQLFIYMAVLVIVGRMLISLFELPNTALVAELAPNYDDRTVVMGFRYFFGTVIGGIVGLIGLRMFLTPIVVNGHKEMGQFNVAGYGPYATMVVVVMFIAIMASSLGTHRHIPRLRQPSVSKGSLWATLRQMAQAVLNRNFVALASSGLIFGITTGISGGLSQYFSTYLWELDTAAQASLGLFALAASVVAVIVGPLLSRRFGKKRTCITLFFIAIFASATPITLKLLGVMPPNHTFALYAILAIDGMVTAAFGIMGFIIVTSMIADIIEEIEVKSGQRSEGLLFSADTVLQKVASGIAILGPGLLLAAVRFPAGARPRTLDPAIMHHLALIYLPIVVGLQICSTSCLFFYRIDKARHQDNLRTLAQSAAAAEMIDPEAALPASLP
jgi:GPH family glycoside/pentoside/hexuronide:cation symporter